MENDAFTGALNPGRPEYKYTNYEGGCSKISDEFENFYLPFDGVIWEEPLELIREGVDLIESIKGEKYKLNSEQLVDPKTVVSFPAVKANLSHLPDTEEDAIKVDVRHWTNAVDEIIRASEPQLPEKVSWWLSESSGSVAGVYKADTATTAKIARDSILIAIRDAMATHRSGHSTPGSRRASTTNSRPSSAASYRNRSPIRKTTTRGSPKATGGGRSGRYGSDRSRGMHDRQRSGSPQRTSSTAQPAALSTPPPASSVAGNPAAPYRTEAAYFAEKSSVTAEPSDRIPVERLLAHVKSVGIVNKMKSFYELEVDPLKMPYLLARVDCLHGRAPEGCTETALQLGIPNGISRPTNAEEYKRPYYVSKFIDNLRKWARREPEEPPKRGRGRSSKFPSVGDNPNCPGVRKNVRQATPLDPGNVHLLKQGFGYILQHRIRCVELTDSIGSVFMEALGLNIDEFTTSPELFRQALKSGPIGAGKLRVTAIKQDQREQIIAARVAFRDRARRGVPDDIVPEGFQLPSAEFYRKLDVEHTEIPQIEDLICGVWLSPKKKKENETSED